jgi:hypothetical protein
MSLQLQTDPLTLLCAEFSPLFLALQTLLAALTKYRSVNDVVISSQACHVLEKNGSVLCLANATMIESAFAFQ